MPRGRLNITLGSRGHRPGTRCTICGQWVYLERPVVPGCGYLCRACGKVYDAGLIALVEAAPEGGGPDGEKALGCYAQGPQPPFILYIADDDVERILRCPPRRNGRLAPMLVVDRSVIRMFVDQWPMAFGNEANHLLA